LALLGYVLQHAEFTLQRIATHCDALQRTATHFNTLQHTATHCNALQRTMMRHDALQRIATHWNTLQHTAPQDSVAVGEAIAIAYRALFPQMTYKEKSSY